MVQITEDYVSFETAKLLKEKGFDEPTGFVYSESGELMKLSDFGVRYLLNSECDDYPHWQFPFEGVSSIVSAPTLQMAMKWLREVHKLHVDVDPSEGDWNPTVITLEDWTCAEKFGDNILIQDTYEEACEAGIKYCLEKLI